MKQEKNKKKKKNNNNNNFLVETSKAIHRETDQQKCAPKYKK